jgi:hypothetical protein
MEVEVGSFSDPEGLEGLAHFLGEFSTSLLVSSASPSPLSSRFARVQRFDFSFDLLRARADRIISRIRVDSWSEDLV